MTAENTKHTPGPWVVSGPKMISSLESGEIVCFPLFGRDSQLIAAAPALLEALKDLFGACLGGMQPANAKIIAMRAAREAIAKAEGRDV